MNFRWIKNEYNSPKIIITENGWSDDGQIDDVGRVAYLRGHLDAVLEARAMGCEVIGYAHWSILDNFEWTAGYAYALNALDLYLNPIS